MASFDNISGDSRIWIYQSNRKFSSEEIAKIKIGANNFVADWSAHGAALEASIEVLHDLFVVVAVDENHAGATGCSIDKSFQFVEALEKEFEITLLDRMLVAYYDNDVVNTCSVSEFSDRIKEGLSDENTLVFNNLIQSRKDIESSWVAPVKDSWQAQLLS